jgi:iron-sulfur cluster repair protein YtfE (RIC family)
MDPVRLIKQDHRRVKVLFRRFEQAKSAAERQKVGEELIEELSVHATIEEQLIYPLIRNANASRGAGAVLNALEEHHVMKLVLAELDAMEVSEARYAAKIHVVRESVESHIAEEERTLLPLLARSLDSAMSRDLTNAMRLMKSTVPNHPHPAAPDEPPGGLVAGILAKMGDAGKDLMRKITQPDKAAGHRRVARRAAANVRALKSSSAA